MLLQSPLLFQALLSLIVHLLLQRLVAVLANVPRVLLDPVSVQTLEAAPPFVLERLALPARVALDVALGQCFHVVLAQVGLVVVFAAEGAPCRARRLLGALGARAVLVVTVPDLELVLGAVYMLDVPGEVGRPRKRTSIATRMHAYEPIR